MASAKFVLKSAKVGQFMFNLLATNGQVILTSERYKQKQGAEEGIASVRENAADDARFERKTAKDGSPYFVLKAANGEVIGKSEMYSSKSSMEKGIQSVRKNAATAVVVDQTEVKANKATVASSGEPAKS